MAWGPADAAPTGAALEAAGPGPEPLGHTRRDPQHLLAEPTFGDM